MPLNYKKLAVFPGMQHLFVLLFFLVLNISICAQISSAEIRKHIEVLSSDSMEGRLVGSQGEVLAAEYIRANFMKAGLKPLPNHDFYHDFSFNYKLNPHSQNSETTQINGRNVVGYIDNKALYTFVIGAHYDHLGCNEYNLSTDPNGKGKIHNGADDNASGVAAILALARELSSNETVESVNYIFACFSGEELGLMGSKSLAKLISTEFPNTSFMMNFDMIGRMDSMYKLNIGGVGTATRLKPIIEALKPQQFNLHIDYSGIGPSDHSSFYLHDIPVLFFFTGVHTDYHKPSDDAHKINYKSLPIILEYAENILDTLSKDPAIPFIKTKSPKKKKNAKFKTTLGILPDYANHGDGLHIQEVIEGRIADQYNFQRGDIITKIGKSQVADIYSYMEALSKIKNGKKYKIEFIRNKDIQKVYVNF